ncbi:Juxtamembrane domain-associated catenin [Trichinella pseudospiralis]|uniref:Juxtamembrane domain-associated catenin n=1 Tax=Trichinella pseudospiralis TaxID=6337 RepID=A0A0V1E4D3_TRIPS|nr:Juxtamembrane domain-associated catenin [Trichinella pseudospiralis]
MEVHGKSSDSERQSKVADLDCAYYNVAAQSISYERSVDCGPLSTDIPERHASQSQKTTKVTKVTTMVSRQNVPSPDRRPLIVNECAPYDAIAHERGSQLQSNGGSLSPSAHHIHGLGYGDFNDYLLNYALPSAPSAPQIIDYDESSVTLSWLPPDRDGDCGYIEGYQVHYRKLSEPEAWYIASDYLILDTTFTVHSLNPGEQYVFSVVAKNSTGFGERSSLSAVVHLKSKSSTEFTQAKKTNVPYPPGRPRIVECDASSVVVAWEPPIFCGSGGPVLGYEICYRSVDSSDWISANDYLVSDLYYRICGLRPTGEYEIQVRAKNIDGYSPASQSVIFQLTAPSTYTYRSAPDIGSLQPPSELRINNVDSTRCTLSWNAVSYAGSACCYVVQLREIGDPHWCETADYPVEDTNLTVLNLRPNSTYEFRIFSEHAGMLSHQCLLSDIVQLRPALLLTSSSSDNGKNCPCRPSAPKVIEIRGNCVTLSWSMVNGVQGYQVEFCEFNQTPRKWQPVNAILTQANRINIGDLMLGREYIFRVIAKNAIGYSEPSEPSQRVVVRSTLAAMDAVPLPVEMREAKESPPITDNDDSPPPLRRFFNQTNSNEIQYRDPTLPEVIDYLDSPNSLIKMNAAGYLQHLTFNDDTVKQKVRALGGIQKLVALLGNEAPEIQKNVAGCLRNLSYGNDDNKCAIVHCGGLTALVELLKKASDVVVVEEVTGTLWNLSSCLELKPQIYQLCTDQLIKQIILPVAAAAGANAVVQPALIFRNATGIVRNVSSASDSIRKSLRQRDSLIEALIACLRHSTSKQDFDSKTVENVVCLARNLSYRLQEVEDPKYDKNVANIRERSKSAPSGSPKLTLKKGLMKKLNANLAGSTNYYEQRPDLQNVAPLFKQDTVKLYLKLLQQSTNPDVLEASAGAVQNLCACYWQPSVDIRSLVRKEKGLPMFVELLRTDEEKVRCASAMALRNLAMDNRNAELIGKYAMTELVSLLPPGSQGFTTSPCTEDTVTSALSLIYTTTAKNSEFAKAMHERNGTQRLMFLAKSNHCYSSKVTIYASQVLRAIWLHKDLHDTFRRSGFKEEDFISLPARSANTLARPLSTAGGERYPVYSNSIYEDDSLLRTQMEGMNLSARGSSISFEHHHNHPPPSYAHSLCYSTHDPLYAQVNKGNRMQAKSPATNSAASVYQTAGDSWFRCATKTIILNEVVCRRNEIKRIQATCQIRPTFNCCCMFIGNIKKKIMNSIYYCCYYHHTLRHPSITKSSFSGVKEKTEKIRTALYKWTTAAEISFLKLSHVQLNKQLHYSLLISG